MEFQLKREGQGWLQRLWYSAITGTLRQTFLCPPTKGEGGHIGFSADPVGVGVGVGVTDLYPRYLLNQLMEFHQICLDISLGQA